MYHDKALSINPNDVDALLNKGTALGGLGQNEQALKYFDKLLAINPNDVEALYNKGAVLLSLGRYQQAIEYFDKVLAINPNDIDALNNKANAIASLGESIQPAVYHNEQFLEQANHVFIDKAEFVIVSGSPLNNYEAIKLYDRALYQSLPTIQTSW